MPAQDVNWQETLERRLARLHYRMIALQVRIRRTKDELATVRTQAVHERGTVVDARNAKEQQ